MDTAPLNALSPSPLAPRESLALEPTDWRILAPAERGRVGRAAGLAAKRALDVVGASTCLVLLAPWLLAVAVWIRYDSAGPVLFRQRRLGRNGRPFWILKFRTMRVDAEAGLHALEARNEASQGVLFKMKDDPRVTRIGHALRRTNVDELPQLWNVLRGEMSLVGPRPFQLRDSERLEGLDAHAFARRLEFSPGLTGAWQVGRSSSTDSERLLEFDLDYIDQWSLGLDLRLIYRTFFIVLRGFLS